MKNYADSSLQDLHNSLYHTKAKFNNCFIINSKYFQNSKNKKCIFKKVGFHFSNCSKPIRNEEIS